MLKTKTLGTGFCGADLWCELIQSDIDGDDEMRYTTYGIKVKSDDGTVLEVEDISVDRGFVEQFIIMLESRNVSLNHVMDVLEDYMI